MTLYLFLFKCFTILFISIFKHLFDMNLIDLLLSTKALKLKYLVVEGLIPNVENAKSVKTLVNDINFDFDIKWLIGLLCPIRR